MGFYLDTKYMFCQVSVISRSELNLWSETYALGRKVETQVAQAWRNHGALTIAEVSLATCEGYANFGKESLLVGMILLRHGGKGDCQRPLDAVPDDLQPLLIGGVQKEATGDLRYTRAPWLLLSSD